MVVGDFGELVVDIGKDGEDCFGCDDVVKMFDDVVCVV